MSLVSKTWYQIVDSIEFGCINVVENKNHLDYVYHLLKRGISFRSIHGSDVVKNYITDNRDKSIEIINIWKLKWGVVSNLYLLRNDDIAYVIKNQLDIDSIQWELYHRNSKPRGKKAMNEPKFYSVQGEMTIAELNSHPLHKNLTLYCHNPCNGHLDIKPHNLTTLTVDFYSINSEEYRCMLTLNPKLKKFTLKIVTGIEDYVTISRELIEHSSLKSVYLCVGTSKGESVENLTQYLNQNSVVKSVKCKFQKDSSPTTFKINNSTLKELIEIVGNLEYQNNYTDYFQNWSCNSSLESVSTNITSPEIRQSIINHHHNITSLKMPFSNISNECLTKLFQSIPLLRKLEPLDFTEFAWILQCLNSYCPNFETIIHRNQSNLFELVSANYKTAHTLILTLPSTNVPQQLFDLIKQNTAIRHLILEFRPGSYEISICPTLFQYLLNNRNLISLELTIYAISDHLIPHIIDYYSSSSFSIQPDKLEITGINIWNLYFQAIKKS
ncbi:hypothetical protein DLAC_11014 [Tieghemostelium lacteum]|uniref:Uncharacterized protein n=1 Tax=Tieghemostelium lacteum TaxID=361077 RepID=A0A151Z2Z5_TIELA|nr:hypothetical protein DLAC_11014 [Tieghemostelium lacteum]|eukprot:KYQ88318.1 hypothetical protein DLAC_11014 [Tieghemostelium lacteum]